MNLYEKALQHLDATPKGKANLAHIAAGLLENPVYAEVLRMALDPYRTFGVRSFPPSATTAQMEFPLGGFKSIMGQLERRDLTGTQAKSALSGLALNGVPSELLTRIIRKDLKAGFGADTVNKLQKDFIPSFKVALAEKYTPVEFPIYVSPKFDGLRCIVMVDDENVQFVSRNGIAFPALQHFEENFLALGVRNCVYDTEVISGNFYASMGQVRQKHSKAEDAQFQVFDMLTLEEFKKRKGTPTQEVRLERVKNSLGKRDIKDPIQVCPHELATDNDVVMARYKQWRSMKLEGLIAKRVKAPYHFGRSEFWTKIKDVVRFDLPVIDVTPGEGKYFGSMGALVVDFRGKSVNIGTGFDDPTRKEFWAMRTELVERHVTGNPMIVEVTGHEVTPDGSIRHGRFERVRHDKVLADGEGN